MKKTFYIILVGLLFACSRKANLLHDNIQDLNNSMQMFYDLNSKTYESDNFEAKIVDIVEVPYVSNKDTMMLYRYRIVIAPKYDLKIKLKSIYLEPSDDTIRDYLSGSSPVGVGNLNMWNGTTEKLDFDAWSNLNDFHAYELSITFNNLTDVFLNDSNIDSDEFKSSLNNLNLVIKYNNKTEEITMDNLNINQVNEMTLNTRKDIQDLSLYGQTYDQFVPYGFDSE